MLLIAATQGADDLIFEPVSRQDAKEWMDSNIVMPEHWKVVVYTDHNQQTVVGVKDKGQREILWLESVPGYAWRTGRLEYQESI